jgi:hypothetical protein
VTVRVTVSRGRCSGLAEIAWFWFTFTAGRDGTDSKPLIRRSSARRKREARADPSQGLVKHPPRACDAPRGRAAWDYIKHRQAAALCMG